MTGSSFLLITMVLKPIHKNLANPALRGNHYVPKNQVGGKDGQVVDRK